MNVILLTHHINHLYMNQTTFMIQEHLARTNQPIVSDDDLYNMLDGCAFE